MYSRGKIITLKLNSYRNTVRTLIKYDPSALGIMEEIRKEGYRVDQFSIAKSDQFYFGTYRK